jgi:hypothetical protein
MPEIACILIAIAIRELSRALPAIIWSIRCPSDSPRYRVPGGRYLGRDR